MVDDFFKTDHLEKEVELSDNKLSAGDEINLKEKDPTMTRVNIGVGWDVNAFDSDVIDLDVSAFMINKDGQTRVDEDFIFYNNPLGEGGAIHHKGDSRTGAGEGDDEIIYVELNGIPFDILEIVFVLSIYKGFEKEQKMDQVQGAFIRIVNAETRSELSRYDLTDDIKDCKDTAFICAALIREGPKWHFKAIGTPAPQGLKGVAEGYGLIIADQ